MTGADIAPVVAILGAVALINLAFAWLFTRGDRDPADFLGSAREVPEDSTAELERDSDRGPDREPSPARTRPATARRTSR